MKNFVQPGKTLTLTAPSGGVVGGNFYLVGALLVCAAIDAAAGKLFTGDTVGVFSVVKPAGQAWAEGERIFWNSSTKVFTKTSASGLFPIGAVARAAATADLAGNVRLDGVSSKAV